MKKKNHYRQGDVLLIRIKSIPDNAVPQVRNNGVLAFGEVTGHSHRVIGGMTFVTDVNRETAEFLRVEKGTAKKVHEEHKPITIPKGDYQVIIQTEFTPDGIRPVAD